MDVDPLTGTPRVVAKLDGFLTSPSQAQPAEIALEYVRAHPDVFKLDADDLARLRLVRDYTDVGGTHHLVWAQTFDGVPAFDNDLRASVTSDGRLLNVLGSPKPDLAVPTVSPDLGAAEALDTALSDVASPRQRTSCHRPRKRRGAHDAVRRRRPGRPRPLRRRLRDAARVARSRHRRGRRGLRHGRGRRDRRGATARQQGSAREQRERVGLLPGSAGPPGIGTQTARDFTPWLSSATPTRLFGPNAHVFADPNDSDTVEHRRGDPTDQRELERRYVHTGREPQAFCEPPTAPCSWNSYGAPRQLADEPAPERDPGLLLREHVPRLARGCTDRIQQPAGNFEGDDYLVADVLNGAEPGRRLSRREHAGRRPPEQRVHGHASRRAALAHVDVPVHVVQATGGRSDPGRQRRRRRAGRLPRVRARPLRPADHVLERSRRSTPSSHPRWGRAGATGTGWTSSSRRASRPTGLGTATSSRAFQGDRSESIDCPVGSPVAQCAGAGTAGAGGYTFGDLGKIFGSPEVHADGEIWAQTLWDLRVALGGTTARGLVTRAMELLSGQSLVPGHAERDPPGRHAQGARTGRPSGSVFAARGHGLLRLDRQRPGHHADPELPDSAFANGDVPRHGHRSPYRCRLGGALVWFGGHTTTLRATTDSAGRFVMSQVPVGTYPQLFVSKQGIRPRRRVASVTVAAGTTTRAIRLRRDWASIPGGARLVRFTGPNNAGICGFGPAPRSTARSPRGGRATCPRSRSRCSCRRWIDMTAFGADPGETCGDPDTASLRGYKVEVSKTGASGSYSLLKRSSFTQRAGRQDQRRRHRHPPGGALRPLHDALELGSRGIPGSLRDHGLRVSDTHLLRPPGHEKGTNARNVILGTAGADVIVGSRRERPYLRTGRGRPDLRRGRERHPGRRARPSTSSSATQATTPLYARTGSASARSTGAPGPTGLARTRSDRVDRHRAPVLGSVRATTAAAGRRG